MQPPTIFSPFFFPCSPGVLAGVSICDATKKHGSVFWKAEVTARATRCPPSRWIWTSPVFFPPHNCLNCDHCFTNDKLSYSLCFWTVLLCTSLCSCVGFFFSLHGFVFFLWHAKTSILESVKLLKRESVRGSGLDLLPSVFVLLLIFCWYVSSYFYLLLHSVQCLLLLLLMLFLSWSNVNGGLQ